MRMYVADYLADTTHLTTIEHGAYFLLICAYWRAEGALPDDDKKLARLAKMTAKEWSAARESLADLFRIEDGHWHHKRIDAELGRVNERSEKARRSVSNRYRKGDEDGNEGSTSVAKADAPEPTNVERTNYERSPNVGDSYNDRCTTSDIRHQISDKESRKVASPPVELHSTDGAKSADVERVFDHWRTVHGHDRAQLDDKRRRIIRAALKRFDPDELCESISGYRNSPHHMGQNQAGTVYDSIELFLRDVQHVEAGLRFARSPPLTASPQSRVTAAIGAAYEQAMEMISNGN